MHAVPARRDGDNHTRTDRPRGRAPTSRTARPALPGSRRPDHRRTSPSGSAARPATVKGYFYDPDGDKAKAVKRRYQGVCRGCGAPTQPRNGKHDPYEYCKACHSGAIATQWTTERVRDAMRAWQHRYGRLPSSYDWSRTHARRRGAQAVERLDDGDWPPASIVGDVFSTWEAARAAARAEI